MPPLWFGSLSFYVHYRNALPPPAFTHPPLQCLLPRGARLSFLSATLFMARSSPLNIFTESPLLTKYYKLPTKTSIIGLSPPSYWKNLTVIYSKVKLFANLQKYTVSFHFLTMLQSLISPSTLSHSLQAQLKIHLCCYAFSHKDGKTRRRKEVLFLMESFVSIRAWPHPKRNRHDNLSSTTISKLQGIQA